MMENTAEQIEDMKEQTIGVEVEMTREISRAAKARGRFFGTENYEDTTFRNGYITWSMESQEREWSPADVSAYGPERRGCEMVTPILNYAGYRDPADLQIGSAMPEPRVSDQGWESTSTSGAGDTVTLRNLVNIWRATSVIAEAMKISGDRIGKPTANRQTRNLWSGSTREAAGRWTKLADVWYSKERKITAGPITTTTAATIC